MRSSVDQRAAETDNEFLQAPQTQRSRLKEKQRLSEDIRGKYISELEQRNRRLKVEIIKINEALAQQSEKMTAKKEPPKLIPFDTNTDVLKKELENAYKQIRSYEKDIHALETKQAGGLITEKMSRMENILKEKNDMLERLRGQLINLNKATIDHAKKLKDNTGKEELEAAMLKFNYEIKNLREKVRQGEQRQKKKQENAKKQYDYIKKMEKELIENGVSTDQLEEISKRNIFTNIFEIAGNRAENKAYKRGSSLQIVSEAKEPKEQPKLKEQEIEDLTLDRYHMLKNDIKTYKKLQQDYQKKLEHLSKEREDTENGKVQVRMRLIERENELEELQQQLALLKQKTKKIDFKAKPPSVKPKDETSKPKVPNYGRVKPKPAPDIENDTHGSLKYDEKGLKTQKGVKFTDRTLIGKNFNTRIVGIKVWTEKLSFNICGIQCIYKVDNITKPGGQYVNKAGKQLYTQNSFQLVDGDYLKSVSGSLGPTNLIEYLILLSQNNKIARYGVVKPNQKQFNFDIQEYEIPVCMYGSLVTRTEAGRPDISLLQHLGFEIMQDGKTERSSV